MTTDGKWAEVQTDIVITEQQGTFGIVFLYNCWSVWISLTLADGYILTPVTWCVACHSWNSSQPETLIAFKVTVRAIAEQGVWMAAVHCPVLWSLNQLGAWACCSGDNQKTNCISILILFYSLLKQLVICGHTLTKRKCMTPVALWQTFCHLCANQIKSLFTLDSAYWAIAVCT